MVASIIFTLCSVPADDRLQSDIPPPPLREYPGTLFLHLVDYSLNGHPPSHKTHRMHANVPLKHRSAKKQFVSRGGAGIHLEVGNGISSDHPSGNKIVYHDYIDESSARDSGSAAVVGVNNCFSAMYDCSPEIFKGDDDDPLCYHQKGDLVSYRSAMEDTEKYAHFMVNGVRSPNQFHTASLQATMTRDDSGTISVEASSSNTAVSDLFSQILPLEMNDSLEGRTLTESLYGEDKSFHKMQRSGMKENGFRISFPLEIKGKYEEDHGRREAPSRLSEDQYAETINDVVSTAKSLPKNVTLQEKLDSFSGCIDVICGNAILYRLTKEHLYLSALSFFEWMRLQTPSLLDSRSLCTVFTMLGEANMVGRAQVLFESLKNSVELLSVEVFNALLSAFSKHGRYEEAQWAFHEMSEKGIKPDSVTFCILLNLAHKRGFDVETIWNIFCDMEKQQVFASHEVFGVLIKAFCDRGMREKGIRLIAEMERRGLIPNVTIYNILIDAYGKASMLEEAEGLLDEMKGKGLHMSVVTYNSLIAAYANRGRFETAEALLEEMLEKGVKPNVQSYTTLVMAYGRHALGEKAAGIFLRMKRNGIAPNIVSYSALIHAHAESGWHEKAEYAFETMLREGFVPTVEIYTSLLHGYRLAGDVGKVKSIWKKMRQEKCNGTRVTFNVIMDAFAKQGCYAEARDVMYEFNRIGYKPDRKTYNMLINAYARGGRHSKLPEILKEMQEMDIHPDSFTYTTLIFSYLRVRDFSNAFRYHEKMCADNQLPDMLTYAKLRSILDEKYEVRVQRNMKAGIGIQQKQYNSILKKEKRKHLWERWKIGGRRRAMQSHKGHRK